MTIEEATKLLKMSDQTIWLKGLEKERREAEEMAIKSLEAWELVKKEVIAKKNFNVEVKDAFEVGSHSRIECNTTAAVLAEVLNLIDKHLAEMENESENENI